MQAVRSSSPAADYLTYAAGRARVPFFVTGGASPETVGAMVEAGADRVVVVRWLTEASDPEHRARTLRAALDHALSSRD
jgi:thiamine-phosphate pyrophosphorylase